MSRFPVRIAITGIGLVTPAGATTETSWRTILDGIATATWFENLPQADRSQGRRFGASVSDDDQAHDRLRSFAVKAARQAIEQAQLDDQLLRSAACVVGTSKSDLATIDELFQSGGAPLKQIDPAVPARSIAEQWNCRAACLSPIAACATGLVSIHRAAQLIREGVCSTALAGGADASIHAGLLASYKRLGVLARPGDDPATACRPFDENRSGFVVGEGAAILVLESWNEATQRGVTPIAEWVDGIQLCDPTGLTSIDPSSEVVSEAIVRLLRQAGVSPDEIDAINFHGTATTMNDAAEAHAAQRVWNERLASMPAFAVKGAIGHLMGAAGAVETALCALALRDKVIPPTVNHQTPDPELSLPRFASSSRQLPVRHMMKLSLGFGGHIAAGLLRSVQ